MRQILLPGFPEGAERVNAVLSILRQDGQVTYFVYGDNYCSHAQSDAAGERLALTSLMANRYVRAAELERSPRKHPHRTLMNWMAQYREHGPGTFYLWTTTRTATPSPWARSPASSPETKAFFRQRWSKASGGGGSRTRMGLAAVVFIRRPD